MDYGQDSLNSVSKINRVIDIGIASFSIFEIVRKIEREDIAFSFDVQRSREKWKEPKLSKLIESIILNIPIQAIYLAAENNNTYIVIDGQQRLNTIYKFLVGRFPLTGLEILSEYNSQYYRDLPMYIKRKIEDYQITVFIIKKDSHPDIKFDIFERINEGATKLNSQELRNCIYRSRGIPFIKYLSQYPEYMELIKSKKVDINGMQHEELVLRFMSFYFKGFEDYKGNMKKFLNDTLEQYDLYRNREGEFEQNFLRTIRNINIVFGRDAFVYRPYRNLKRIKINISLFDILTYSFSKWDDSFICANQSIIVQKLDRLMNYDHEFIESITGAPLTRSNTILRFKKWLYEVENY